MDSFLTLPDLYGVVCSAVSEKVDTWKTIRIYADIGQPEFKTASERLNTAEENTVSPPLFCKPRWRAGFDLDSAVFESVCSFWAGKGCVWGPVEHP